MLQLFGLLSGLVLLIGGVSYLKDTLASKTKPHRVAFLIWSILGAIAFFTQLAEGARWSLVLPASDTIGVLVIFFLAVKRGEGSFNRQDKLALAAAAVGLILWYFTKQPLVALCITVAIDAVGTVLTIHKTYLDPESETFLGWFLSGVAGLFAAAAVGRLSFALLLYPAYLCIANGAIAAIVLLKRPPESLTRH
jgi:hypothetical protein